MAEIIVQKFGGTSVGSVERIAEVAKIVEKSAQENNIIVVSETVQGNHKLRTSRNSYSIKESGGYTVCGLSQPMCTEIIRFKVSIPHVLESTINSQ